MTTGHGNLDQGASLRVAELSIAFPGGGRPAVDRVSFDLAAGRCLGIVGESGSGKSTLGFAVAGLLQNSGAEVTGQVQLGSSDNLLTQSVQEWNAVRGRRIGYVFQEPMTSLNPLLSVGRQVREPMARHLALSRRAAEEQSLALFRSVEIPDATRRMRQYPHEMSGGMRQRVVLAIALSGAPQLLVADEPTTALDVTVQAQVITLLTRLNAERGMTLLFISHDLNVVSQVADDLVVMRGGAVVEKGSADRLLKSPSQEYTQALLADIPRFRYPQRITESKFWGTPS